MNRYRVVKHVASSLPAYLTLPASENSEDAFFQNDKAKAATFPRITALLWAWDLKADIEMTDDEL